MTIQEVLHLAWSNRTAGTIVHFMLIRFSPKEHVMKIKIDGDDYEVPEVFRACLIYSVTGRGHGYRVFEGDGDVLGKELHPTEWVVPTTGQRFSVVPIARGPGGNGDRRVRLIQAAIEAEAEEIG